MTTIASVMSASTALTAAFEELAIVQQAALPARFAGMSSAMEETNNVTDVDAKRSVWQKIKDMIAKFFNFILGRNKKVEEKVDAVIEKTDQESEKFDAFLKEMVKPAPSRPSSPANNYAASMASVGKAVLAKGQAINTLAIATISGRVEDNSILATYLGKTEWSGDDFALAKPKFDRMIAISQKCDQLYKEYKDALSQGLAGATRLGEITKSFNDEDLTIVENVAAKNTKVKFVGQLNGLQPQVDGLIKTIHSVKERTGNKLQAVRDLEMAFQTAADAADAKGEAGYAKSLHDAILFGIGSISLAQMIIFNHLAQLGMAAGMIISAITTAIKFIGDDEQALIAEIEKSLNDAAVRTFDINRDISAYLSKQVA